MEYYFQIRSLIKYCFIMLRVYLLSCFSFAFSYLTVCFTHAYHFFGTKGVWLRLENVFGLSCLEHGLERKNIHEKLIIRNPIKGQ